MMAEQDRQKWNEKYKEKINNDSVPIGNGTLRALSTHLVGGEGLDVACGLGSNSLYLANLGYRMTALDVSDVAIDYLRARAKEDGLSITAKQVDLDHIEWPERAYDLVVVTYFLDRQLLQRLEDTVKPGGFLFMETFYETSGTHPQMNPAFKLRPNEWRDRYQGWNIIYFSQDQEKGIQSLLACRPDRMA
ncbi:bifunctional 2-polyprenyl-6-hydroxyphenol methylase/3-demethylubiquinol 3-O-methyltransferase UbiG [Ammoniphilus sp. CFH 90114]|uniref:class I SAM-dependent methyltransferase n=1 Tax=Ammoniphilus sp. CFH 90114 TaxID=2493665 RepID=UPI00100F0ED8|nr:class I SAM-dependent methyltransferase [Ammoniphilus sp. CFH 90114]RXT04160.1 class I SAM-dependent methyltransferase [Ammoniphilus sp. CFH 90114]